jgi:hypothetical protein
MNCFEARNGFVAFWRKTLAPQDRAALATHLKQCAGCDRAFRTFALTAGPLYSEVVPAAAPGTVQRRRQARVAPQRLRRDVSRRAIGSIAAMLAMLAAASFAAYLSAVVPTQSLDDALSVPDAASELLGQDDLQVQSPIYDFAG